MFDWKGRVAQIVRARGSRAARPLVDEVRLLVDELRNGGEVDLQVLENLEASIPVLTEWAGSQAPDFLKFSAQLRALQLSIGERISLDLFNAFIGQFPKPKPGNVDLTDVVLGSRSRTTVDRLLDRRLLRAKDLTSIAKRKPAEFFLSSGLDVLVSEGKPAPRVVWKEFDSLPSRPVDLLTAAQAFARSYRTDIAPDASKWTAQFLAGATTLRSDFFRAILKDTFASFRFAHYLAFDHASLGAKRKKTQHLTDMLVGDWIAVIDRRSDFDPVHHHSMLLIAGVLRLALAGGSKSLSPKMAESIRDTSERLAIAQAISALRESELGVSSKVSEVPWVVSRLSLAESVQEYLKNLPLPLSEEMPPERAFRLERYLGRRGVLNDVVHALEQSDKNEVPRESMEAVLFNAGVREVGQPGDIVKYDVRIHETNVSGLMPNDVVVLAKPPRFIGTSPDTVLLTKGMVNRSEQERLPK